MELVIVLAVIAVLVAIGYAVFSSLPSRAQRIQCTANLRNLYIAAEAYVQQNGSWPQISMSNESDTADQDYATAWIAALKPFGPSEKTWICPTVQNLLQNPDYMSAANQRVDYIATPFDQNQLSPHQWPKQPWFIESADVHGDGNLIIFADGSISDLNTAKAQAH